MVKQRERIKVSKPKGGIRMAVSKATLGCVKGEVGTRLIKDIKNTTVNMDIIDKCKILMKKIAKGDLK